MKKENYKALYEKLIGPLSEETKSINDLYRLLAACGKNPTNDFVKKHWKLNFTYSDFVMTVESCEETKNLLDVFKKKFGNTVSR
jgi:hypothetical protein